MSITTRFPFSPCLQSSMSSVEKRFKASCVIEKWIWQDSIGKNTDSSYKDSSSFLSSELIQKLYRWKYLHFSRFTILQSSFTQDSDKGSRHDMGRGFSFLWLLKWVKAMKPPMDTAIPKPETKDIGTLKITDVTTMAKSLRMQFKAAWWTTDILVKINVDARLEPKILIKHIQVNK